MKNKRPIAILISVVIILLIPFIAMQFTNEVNWTLFDFIVAGVLLLSFGLSVELVLRKVKIRKYRIALVLAFLFALLLIWAELAVGIFGTPLGGS